MLPPLEAEDAIAELHGLCQLVLRAIAAAPTAWSSRAELVAAVGLPLGGCFDQMDPFGADFGTDDALTGIDDALADLDVSGWIECWEPPVGLLVTLTPWAAERLGLRLIEVGPDEVPRWAGPFTPEPFPPKARGIFRDPATLEVVYDPTDGPARAAERREARELAHARANSRGADPLDRRPTRFCGERLWDRPAEGQPCVCVDQPRSIYCLRCDNRTRRRGRPAA